MPALGCVTRSLVDHGCQDVVWSVHTPIYVVWLRHHQTGGCFFSGHGPASLARAETIRSKSIGRGAGSVVHSPCRACAPTMPAHKKTCPKRDFIPLEAQLTILVELLEQRITTAHAVAWLNTEGSGVHKELIGLVALADGDLNVISELVSAAQRRVLACPFITALRCGSPVQLMTSPWKSNVFCVGAVATSVNLKALLSMSVLPALTMPAEVALLRPLQTQLYLRNLLLTLGADAAISFTSSFNSQVQPAPHSRS